jgi:hypothetical protein
MEASPTCSSGYPGLAADVDTLFGALTMVSSPEDGSFPDKYECVAGLDGEINAHVTCDGCHLWGHVESNCNSRSADDGRNRSTSEDPVRQGC